MKQKHFKNHRNDEMKTTGTYQTNLSRICQQLKSFNIMITVVCFIVLVNFAINGQAFGNNRNIVFSDRRFIISLHSKNQATLLSSSADSYSLRSKRRKAPNSKISLQWVIESIERSLYESETKYIHASFAEQRQLLLKGLYRMLSIKTKKDAMENETLLLGLGIHDIFSYDVQERVLKAASMSGYMTLAFHLLDSMLDAEDGPYIPSYIAYNSVLTRLRKWKRLQQMKEVLEKIAARAKTQGIMVHQVALNTYLSCLCDSIKTRSASQDELMEEALSLLRPGVSFNIFAVAVPDMMSHNIVLNAAASAQKFEVVTETIQLMENRKLQLDTYSYNALIKSAQSDIEKMDVFGKLQKPDKYTIELILLPLLKNGRVSDALDLLEDFNRSETSDMEKCNAYSTFLISLVKDCQSTFARAIFDSFILPQSMEPSECTIDFWMKNEVNIVRSRDSLIKPHARHFNALFEGYKNDYERSLSKQDLQTGQMAIQNSRSLMSHMKLLNVKPDAYTITLMMGLQSTSSEISNLWNDLLHWTDIEFSPPIYHSLISAYGNANDIESACRVFDHMLAVDALSPSLNSWNVMLDALAKASSHNSERVINCDSTPKFRSSVANRSNSSADTVDDTPFILHMNGLTPPEAARSILDLMIEAKVESKMNDMILRPTSQTYVLVATSLAYHNKTNGIDALCLYNHALENNISIDGRFMNAILRCYGENIVTAISDWKTKYRSSMIIQGKNDKSTKNLIAAYNGLVQVAGRAYRPDIALRIAYAMSKDGIEPNETTWNNYNSGVRKRSEQSTKVRFHSQYEELLAVECTKYCSNDKRRLSEKRVRIII